MSQEWKERQKEGLSHKDKEREAKRESKAYGGVREKVKEKKALRQGQLESKDKN